MHGPRDFVDASRIPTGLSSEARLANREDRNLFSVSIERILMLGRPKKERPTLYGSLEIEDEFGVKHTIGNIEITCPDCNGKMIAEDGMRRRKGTRVQGFRCLDQGCMAKRGKKSARQFFLTSSGKIRQMIKAEIRQMVEDLYRRGAKAKTVAEAHGVSEGLVSFLKSSVDKAIELGKQADALLKEETTDAQVSIDETFFKIGGTTVYVIIVRGYQSSKVLGINVSTTRAEVDIRKAFDEAQSNSAELLNVITIDGLEASRAMARHLGYPITLVIHPHRKPYDKAIIERIEYDHEFRTITHVGVETDIFVQRKRRVYYYTQEKKPLLEPPKRPVGRPKGSKNKKKPIAEKAGSKKSVVDEASLPFSQKESVDT
jgi:transposase-like protein